MLFLSHVNDRRVILSQIYTSIPVTKRLFCSLKSTMTALLLHTYWLYHLAAMRGASACIRPAFRRSWKRSISLFCSATASLDKDAFVECGLD